MKKVLLFLLVFLVAAAAFAFIARNAIIKTVIETAVSGVTGFPTKVESISLDYPNNLQIAVKGLTIKNPQGRGFEKEIFADIPEIFLQVNVNELLRRERIHLPEIHLNIAQVNFVTSSNTQTSQADWPSDHPACVRHSEGSLSAFPPQ